MCVAPLENKLNYAYYEQPLGSLFVTLLIGILASQSWTAHKPDNSVRDLYWIDGDISLKEHINLSISAISDF